ncbi:MAG: LysR family transcriptional regulator [Ruthenibacterium lactatiformans]
MNLQQLRYAVEVAKTGSITAAAKNLYMGQPNLSKSIRELEAELGITLFERTGRGGAHQKRRGFSGLCPQHHRADGKPGDDVRPHTETGTQLSVCAPRASYVAQAFSRYLGAEGRAPLQVQYRETSAAAVISDVASGTANLGVVRWQAEHAATLDNLLRENALSGEVLWEFSMVVLLHERHPLAALGDIPYHLLGDYPEIVHGDLTPVLPAEQPAQAAGGRQGRIAVFDRGGQFDILRNVPGSYMWVSPVPFEILAQQELVQKPCRSASRYRDVLVRRRPGALSAAEVAFINELRREIAGLVQT